MSGGFPNIPEACNASAQGTGAAPPYGTAVVSGNNVYGTYAQLVASTPSDTSWMIVMLFAPGSVTGKRGIVRLAVGAAGSEQVIVNDIEWALNNTGITEFGALTHSFPICIPAGTRIAASAKQPANTDSVYVSVILLDSDMCGVDGVAGVDSIGVSGGGGTACNPSATANAKGAYAQLSASTPRDYVGIFAAVHQNSAAGSETLLDIAIGVSGSEVVILPNIRYTIIAVSGSSGGMGAYVPVQIPAGTRVAARVEDQSANSAAIYDVMAYGLYR